MQEKIFTLALFFGIYAMVLELKGLKNTDQMLYAGVCILLLFLYIRSK
jgi:hypothetical protein